jgi:hypothetical protein
MISSLHMLSNHDVVDWKDPSDTESVDEDQEKPGTVFMNSMEATPSWLHNDLTDIFTKPQHPLEQLFDPPKSDISPEKLFSGQYDTLTKRRLSEIISYIPPAASSDEKRLEYPNDIDFLEDLEQGGDVLRLEATYHTNSVPTANIVVNKEIEPSLDSTPVRIKSGNGTQKVAQSCDLSHQKLESLKNVFHGETSITRLKLYLNLT